MRVFFARGIPDSPRFSNLQFPSCSRDSPSTGVIRYPALKTPDMGLDLGNEAHGIKELVTDIAIHIIS